MQAINALSLGTTAADWLAKSLHPRILHIFDPACNLINEHRGVLSIVTVEIGDGPFHLVVEDNVLFSKHLRTESPISITDKQLRLGPLTIDTSNAQLWDPCPDWDNLHAHRDKIAHQVAQRRSTTCQFFDSLSSYLAKADLSSSLLAAEKLAGLGVGLTPSGDDYLMGAMYAAWILHPADAARAFAQGIANIAAPRTTSLSAAWLRAAGRGEAGILWHQLFGALVVEDNTQIQETFNKILAVGETSGADALAGFVGTFSAWMKIRNSSHG